MSRALLAQTKTIVQKRMNVPRCFPEECCSQRGGRAVWSRDWCWMSEGWTETRMDLDMHPSLLLVLYEERKKENNICTYKTPICAYWQFHFKLNVCLSHWAVWYEGQNHTFPLRDNISINSWMKYSMNQSWIRILKYFTNKLLWTKVIFTLFTLVFF